MQFIFHELFKLCSILFLFTFSEIAFPQFKLGHVDEASLSKSGVQNHNDGTEANSCEKWPLLTSHDRGDKETKIYLQVVDEPKI